MLNITYDNIRYRHTAYPYFTQLQNQPDSKYTYEPKNTEFLQNFPVNYNDDITAIPNFLHKCKRCIEVLHGKLIMGTLFPSDIGNSAINELLIRTTNPYL